MMKKLTVALSVLAILGLAAPAMAQGGGNTGYWGEDGAEVYLDIDVPLIAETWSSIGTGQARDGDDNVVLEITNFGAFIEDANRAHDSVSVATNGSNADVSVQVNGTFPDYVAFHVLVNPNNDTYTRIDDASASADLVWGHTGEGDGATQAAFVAGHEGSTQDVDYVVTAHDVVDQQTVSDIEVVWTVSPN